MLIDEVMARLHVDVSETTAATSALREPERGGIAARSFKGLLCTIAHCIRAATMTVAGTIAEEPPGHRSLRVSYVRRRRQSRPFDAMVVSLFEAGCEEHT